MNGSPELLEFYLVEATEYVDALDQLVGGATSAPDGNALIATARALRGSSTMAKADEIAELSLLIEQLAHALRDGEQRWTLDLFQSMRGTVDDLRFLVRGVRMWGAREDARAQARLAELKRFLPSESPRAETPTSGQTAPVFVALQASAIAAELDAFVQNSSNKRALDDALTRARTLRGIAGIADYAPLGDVADAVERAGRALMPDAPLAAGDSELFRSAAAVLRRASDELRAGRPNSTNTDEVARFARAVASLQHPVPTPDQVVAIDSLFYDDAGPHVIERRNPPMTPEQRFRQELSARGEHVTRLVSDARQLRDDASRARIGHDLAGAIRDLEHTAHSFGAHQAAGFFSEAAREAPLLAAPLLDALDHATRVIRVAESPSVDEMERRLALIERARRTPPSSAPQSPIGGARSAAVAPTPSSVAESVPTIARADTAVGSAPTSPPAPNAARAPGAPPLAAQRAVPTGTGAAGPSSPAAGVGTPPAAPAPAARTAAPPPAPPAATVRGAPPSSNIVPPPAAAPRGSATPSTSPAPVAPPARKAPMTPTGRELSALLSQGIAAFAPLDDTPLVPPSPVEEEAIVPIESLLYRGAAALDRAIDIRDSLRARGLAGDDSLSELFDLLDLARSE